jgi:hypothetical protein
LSAFYAVAYRDRIELLTDGALYEDDGTVRGFEQKVWTSSHAPIAYTGRGNAAACKAFGEYMQFMSLVGSFDQYVEAFMKALERQQAKRGDQFPALDGLLVGISETAGPKLFYFHTYRGTEGMYATMEPWRLYDAGVEWYGGPDLDRRNLRDSGLPMFWSMDGVREYGVEFFELARRHKLVNLGHPDKPMVYGLGGHIDLTTVRPEGCTVERIHEWPDVVGEKIVPVGVKEAA